MVKHQEILDAKHISIVVDEDSFANGSALYTYLMTLHKKVSFVSHNNISIRYNFLPWYDKIRTRSPQSADLEILMDDNIKGLYLQLKEKTINKKMALSLYASLCMRYKFFTSDECDGTEFAIANELIEYGADFKIVKKSLYYSFSLSLIRLKSIMLKEMHLTNNAKTAVLYIDDDILKATGSDIKEAIEVMYDVLRMVRVESVELLDKDNNIIKILKKEI
jgi:phosphoesterase RecJ-like protein